MFKTQRAYRKPTAVISSLTLAAGLLVGVVGMDTASAAANCSPFQAAGTTLPKDPKSGHEFRGAWNCEVTPPGSSGDDDESEAEIWSAPDQANAGPIGTVSSGRVMVLCYSELFSKNVTTRKKNAPTTTSPGYAWYLVAPLVGEDTAGAGEEVSLDEVSLDETNTDSGDGTAIDPDAATFTALSGKKASFDSQSHWMSGQHLGVSAGKRDGVIKSCESNDTFEKTAPKTTKASTTTDACVARGAQTMDTATETVTYPKTFDCNMKSATAKAYLEPEKTMRAEQNFGIVKTRKSTTDKLVRVVCYKDIGGGVVWVRLKSDAASSTAQQAVWNDRDGWGWMRAENLVQYKASATNKLPGVDKCDSAT